MMEDIEETGSNVSSPIREPADTGDVRTALVSTERSVNMPGSSTSRSPSPVHRLPPGTTYKQAMSRTPSPSGRQVAELTSRLETEALRGKQVETAAVEAKHQAQLAMQQAQQSMLRANEFQATLEASLQAHLATTSTVSKQQIQDFTHQMMQDMRAATSRQIQQDQKIREQDEQLRLLKEELVNKEQNRRRDMTQLQQQVNTLSLGKAESDWKAQELEKQLLSRKEEVQQATTTLETLWHNVQGMQNELQTARKEREDLRQAVEYLHDEEPVYENELGARGYAPKDEAHEAEILNAPISEPLSIPMVQNTGAPPKADWLKGMGGDPLFVPPMTQPSLIPPVSVGLDLFSQKDPVPATPAASFSMLQIRPKDPPYFNGNIEEDVETWLYSVAGYAKLLGASETQTLDYAVTLLQKDAKDWWVSLLKTHQAPSTFRDLWPMMTKRFGTRMMADKARATLLDIFQRPAESVRAYSNRFSHWVGKLPEDSTCDPWLMDLYYSGLHTSIAELLLLQPQTTLEDTMERAEVIETSLAKAQRRKPGAYKTTTAKTGLPQKSPYTPYMSGRRRGFGRSTLRGRGETPSTRVVQRNSQNYTSRVQVNRGADAMRCYRCGRIGHLSWNCPNEQAPIRGRGRMLGRGAGRGGRQRSSRFAAVGPTTLGPTRSGAPQLLEVPPSSSGTTQGNA